MSYIQEYIAERRVARRLHLDPAMPAHRSPRRRDAELTGGLAALAAFLLVAALDEPTPLDRAVYALAGRLYDRRIERALLPLEILGLPGVYIPVAHLVARAARARGAGDASAISRSAWAAWLTLRTMRLLVHRPRPPRPPGRGPKKESTFPSGHTIGLTTLALVAADVLAGAGILGPREARVLRYGVPLAIGANRLYVREHWLTDVAGALSLGAAVASACRLLSSPSSRLGSPSGVMLEHAERGHRRPTVRKRPSRPATAHASSQQEA